MLAVPAATPVAIPVVGSTEATAVLLLLQVPAPVLNKAVVVPGQIVVTPVMSDGNGFMVSSTVSMQPVATAYVIIAMPFDTPEIMPVVAPTVAIAVALLLQVPPVVVLVNVVNAPAHIAREPVMGAGVGLTVTAINTEQPVDSV